MGAPQTGFHIKVLCVTGHNQRTQYRKALLEEIIIEINASWSAYYVNGVEMNAKTAAVDSVNKPLVILRSIGKKVRFSFKYEFCASGFYRINNILNNSY